MHLLAPILAAAAFVAPPPHRLRTGSAARHAPVVARELAFVADLEVKTEPFALVESKPIGKYFGREDALKILMSQAESSKRLDANGEEASLQSWEGTHAQAPTSE